MTGFGELYRLGRETVAHAFDPRHEPRLEVSAPAEILIETHDARGGKLREPRDVITTAPDLASEFPKTNPVTGPVRIRGAEPGDTLIVDVRSIELESYGFIIVRPEWGIVRGLVNEMQAKVVPIRDGWIEIDRCRLPVRPNIGVLGTAPVDGPIGTLFLGRHGGNMDNNRITVGTRVHLPVRVPGALF